MQLSELVRMHDAVKTVLCTISGETQVFILDSPRWREYKLKVKVDVETRDVSRTDNIITKIYTEKE